MRKQANKFILAMVPALFLAQVPAAQSQIISNPAAELQKFCEYDTTRRTIIYLDQSVIGKKDENWFRDIQKNDLEYMPSERIHIRMIEEGRNSATEVWSTCYPKFTPEQYAIEKDNESIFSKGTDRRLKDAQDIFVRYLNRALAQPIANASNNDRPNYDGNFPSKSLVETLYYDSSQFALDGKTTRVIIFSDMVENSKFFDPQNTDEQAAHTLARDAAKEFPANFRNAEFHVYGVGYSHRNAELSRNLEKFWALWLNKSSGRLASFAPQLSIPLTGPELNTVSYKGMLMQFDESVIATRLRLSFTNSGKLNNSWLELFGNHYPLDGTYVCSDGVCTVNAKVAYVDPGMENGLQVGDALQLKGPLRELEGTLGSEDSTQLTPDGKVFKMRVKYDATPTLTF